MLENVLKESIGLWIPIVLCALGSVCAVTKDATTHQGPPANAKYSSLILSSLGKNSYQEESRRFYRERSPAEVAKKADGKTEGGWSRKNHIDGAFILDIHRDLNEWGNSGLSSLRQVLTTEVAREHSLTQDRIPTGNEYKAPIGNSNNGRIKLGLLEIISSGVPIEDNQQRNKYRKVWTSDDENHQDHDIHRKSSVVVFSGKERRQKRSASSKFSSRDPDRIHFPDSQETFFSSEATETRLNRPASAGTLTRHSGGMKCKNCSPNSGKDTINFSGLQKQEDEDDDGVNTYILTGAPSRCPSGQTQFKGRCRTIRE